MIVFASPGRSDVIAQKISFKVHDEVLSQIYRYSNDILSKTTKK